MATRPNGARGAAALVLLAVWEQGRRSDQALDETVRQMKLDARDRALCAQLVYGVLQNRLLLDYDLAPCLSRPLEKVDGKVRIALELGAYQLLFLDKIPPSAAVNESVTLVKRWGMGSAAGFVNGVLRTLLRRRDRLPPLPEEEADFVAHWSLKTSHPNWLVERLCRQYGREETRQILLSHAVQPPVTVRVNRLKTDRDAAMEEMRRLGLEVRAHPALPNCVQLPRLGELLTSPPFTGGKVTVQDAASVLCVDILDPKPGQTVIDCCAAPGGKSCYIGEKMDNRGALWACDLHPNKVARIDRAAARLGITVLHSAVRDAAVCWSPWLDEAEAVLCDAPCSGLGVIGKKPEIRYKDPAQIGRLPAIQQKILDNVCRYVKPGGTLVYSTCTILQEENQQVVEQFLARHGAFALCPFDTPLTGPVPGGMVQLLPHRHGTDGFFVAKMRRKA